MKAKVAVLVSGGGTNLQAILDKTGSVITSAVVEVVIADNPDAYALERAKKAGIAAVVVDKRAIGDRQKFEERIIEE